MKLKDISQLNKKYVNTLLIENGELHYFPYLVGKTKKNKSFWNYEDVINTDDVKDYLTDEMRNFMENTNTILIRNSKGFLHYNLSKDQIINHNKLNKLINNK